MRSRYRLALGAVATALLLISAGSGGRAHGEAGAHRDLSRPRMTGPLEPDQERRALEFVRQFDPERLSRLERLKAQAPDRYNFSVRRLLWMQKHFENLRLREDSTAYERQVSAFRRIFLLQGDAEDIVVRYRNTADKQLKAQLRTELTDKITQVFETWEQVKRDEVGRMEAELARLKRIVGERQRERAAIVERRVRHMLEEAETEEDE